jgi:capsule polysaccharide export protein KpsC/LpsZ
MQDQRTNYSLTAQQERNNIHFIRWHELSKYNECLSVFIHCTVQKNMKVIHNATHKKTILDFAHVKFLLNSYASCFTVQAAKNVHLQEGGKKKTKVLIW